MNKALKLDKRLKLDIPEADVQRAGDDLMQAYGWRLRPQPVNLHCPHCGANIPVPGAEQGQPDRLYLKSTFYGGGPTARILGVYVEYKKRGEKPTREQRAHHEYLRKSGFAVLVWDEIQDVADWLGVRL